MCAAAKAWDLSQFGARGVNLSHVRRGAAERLLLDQRDACGLHADQNRRALANDQGCHHSEKDSNSSTVASTLMKPLEWRSEKK